MAMATSLVPSSILRSLGSKLTHNSLENEALDVVTSMLNNCLRYYPHGEILNRGDNVLLAVLIFFENFFNVARMEDH